MISLTVTERLLSVDPWVPELEPILTCYRKKMVRVRNQTMCDITPEPLFHLQEAEDRTVGLTYSGFLERVVRELVSSRKPYKFIDSRKQLPEADLDKIPNSLRQTQDVLLSTILCSHGGLILAPCGLGKTFVVEQLCKAYSGQKIMVVTQRSSVLKDIYRRVCEACPDKMVGMVNAGNALDETSDVAIVSSKSLHKVNEDWPDIVLYDEAHTVCSPETSFALSSFSGRMFGFTASPEGRSDDAEIMMEALFGPVLCSIDYQEAVDKDLIVPLQVLVFDVHTAEVKRKSWTYYDRYNIWQNIDRNEMIAQVARNFDAEEKILIMVDKVEHAFYLRQHLPEFTLAYASLDKERLQDMIKDKLATAEDKTSPDVSGLKDAFRKGEIKKMISTYVFREGVDVPDLQVLIRADAGKGQIPAIQIAGRLSRKFKGKECGYLIDFSDSFSKNLHRRYLSRRRFYKQQGWSVDLGTLKDGRIVF